MTAYIATFHTHLSALLTCRALTAAGVAAQMMPVPRRLSAACGTCVRYTADSPMLSCMDTDYEAVYETADKNTPGAEQLRESFYVGERTAVPGGTVTIGTRCR